MASASSAFGLHAARCTRSASPASLPAARSSSKATPPVRELQGPEMTAAPQPSLSPATSAWTFLLFSPEPLPLSL